MKLEDALPEIRKGRRFRNSGSRFYTLDDWGIIIRRIDLESDDWELEPLPAPKMKAWIDSNGMIRLINGDHFGESYGKDMHWTRAEWLDQPT